MFLSRGPLDFGDCEVTDFPGSCLFKSSSICENWWPASCSVFYRRVALADRVFSGHDPKATCLSHRDSVVRDLGWKCQSRPSLAVCWAILKLMILIDVCAHLHIRLQIAWWSLPLSSEIRADICGSSGSEKTSEHGWLRHAHEPVASQLQKVKIHFLLNLNNWKWGKIPKSELWSRTEEPWNEWRLGELEVERGMKQPLKWPSWWMASRTWGISSYGCLCSPCVCMCVCLSVFLSVSVCASGCLCPSESICVCECVCRSGSGSMSVCRSVRVGVFLSYCPGVNWLLQEFLLGRLGWAGLLPHLVSDQCRNAASRQK